MLDPLAAEENLAGVRTVKAFAREKFEIEKFSLFAARPDAATSTILTSA